MAEPRFLEGSIDPNYRPIGTCFMGDPETLNTGPMGSARLSTLRSWLSQWSPDDTHAQGEKCAADISMPMLAIEHSAADAVSQRHTGRIYAACASVDKSMLCLKGATHNFSGQPDLLAKAAQTCMDWMEQRRLLD
jgi:hypothetical protein